MVSGRNTNHAQHKPHRRQHPYALRGLVFRGLCERRMQSRWVHDVPYYRRRFPSEYALANRVEHPLNVNLREDAIIGRVDKWLARELAPHRMSDTLHALAEARQPGTRPASAEEAIASKIAECDRKLAQYRAALDAGANPTTVAGWIAETEAEKAAMALVRRRPEPRPRLTEQEIRSIVEKFADTARVLIDADPDDKADILRQLGLRLTYHPGRQLVKAQIEVPQGWYFDGVRGPSRNLRHDQHRADQGVHACRWRCAVSVADRVIRWSTALAVAGVAVVAAVVSYEHA